MLLLFVVLVVGIVLLVIGHMVPMALPGRIVLVLLGWIAIAAAAVLLLLDTTGTTTLIGA